jgi:hypothetical protein
MYSESQRAKLSVFDYLAILINIGNLSVKNRFLTSDNLINFYSENSETLIFLK